MINFQGNVLTVVDVETTGLIDGYHDLIQVACVPLNNDLEPLDVSPFYMNIRPENPERADPEALRVNGLKLSDLSVCIDRWQAADCFDEWFEGLGLPMYKKLIYLTQNAPFDIGFMRHWLGCQGFEKYFTRRGRDTMFTALALNDQAAWKNKPIPFNRVGLKDLCQHFGIQQDNHHDALNDCLVTAKVYRELLRFEV